MNRDNYPAMTQSQWENASWNEKDAEEKDVEIIYSCSLSRNLKVAVDDYTSEEWYDEEYDEEGHLCKSGGVDYDFSDCNLREAFFKNHYGIEELLNQLKELLKEKIEEYSDKIPTDDKEVKASKKALLKVYKAMLEDCEGYAVDDEEFELNE